MYDVYRQFIDASGLLYSHCGSSSIFPLPQADVAPLNAAVISTDSSYNQRPVWTSGMNFNNDLLSFTTPKKDCLTRCNSLLFMLGSLVQNQELTERVCMHLVDKIRRRGK